jgi:HK97 family phage major capsid protein
VFVEVCRRKNHKENTEMNIEVEKRELQRQIDALLAKPSLTTSERKQCDLLMSKVANLRSTEERRARVEAMAAEVGLPVSDEQRAKKIERAFDFYVRSGDASELRTYAPEDTTSAGVLIPQQWAGSYLDRLKASTGIREAGANIITTKTGHPYKFPLSDDTANDGERLAENAPVTLANPTESTNLLGAFRYGSKGIQFSGELAQDLGFDLNAYLQDIFAARIGRLTNREFTLGASGGPAGVLPSITNVQTTASATAVAVAELVGLQALDAAYLPGSVYMFSPGVERALKAMVGTDGLPIFPEMRTGKILLGFPYVLNVAMASALTATAETVVFGNFRRGVTIREVTPMLVVSRERFAEQGMMYASLTHRQDCQVVDASALAVLQQHA